MWTTSREKDCLGVCLVLLAKSTVDFSRTGEFYVQATCYVYVLRLRSLLLKLTTWSRFPNTQHILSTRTELTGLCFFTMANRIGSAVFLFVQPINSNGSVQGTLMFLKLTLLSDLLERRLNLYLEGAKARSVLLYCQVRVQHAGCDVIQGRLADPTVVPAGSLQL